MAPESDRSCDICILNNALPHRRCKEQKSVLSMLILISFIQIHAAGFIMTKQPLISASFVQSKFDVFPYKSTKEQQQVMRPEIFVRKRQPSRAILRMSGDTETEEYLTPMSDPASSSNVTQSVVPLSKDEEREMKMKKALELAKKVRSSATPTPAAPKQTTSGIGGSWAPPVEPEVETHKPKVSTWGVFERPADISKAYGGGRQVGVNGYQPSEGELAERESRTRQLLNAYRQSVGVDRELEERHAGEIKEALRQHEAFMRNNAISKAVSTLEKVTQWTSYKSALGGQVYLNLALAYEAAGDRGKAKATYTKLQQNADQYVSSKARELLFGFEAMEFMRVNATFEAKDRKVMSFQLPDVAQYTYKRYDTAFFDKEAAKRRAAAASAAAAGRARATAASSQFSATDIPVEEAPAGVAVRPVTSRAGDVGSDDSEDEPDVIVIGSGLAGLSCAALLGRYGFRVTVLESHTHAGGAAHSFDARGSSGGIYRFDSGPSLFSGLSEGGQQGQQERCVNPLKQVLDAVGERVECINYDTWGVCIPEGDFPATVGAEAFAQDLQRLLPGEEGRAAAAEWRRLQEYMRPLAAASVALPPAAIRFDAGLLATLPRYLPSLVKSAGVGGFRLVGPYSAVLDDAGVKTPLIRRWLDMLSFLLSGLPADGTIAAEVAFMFAEWYRPGVKLDYPRGGSAGVVDALVRGVEKHGGKLRLRTHVDQILIENGAATGVRLRGGRELRAKRAVISNAPLKATLGLLPPGAVPADWARAGAATPECPSFMHLHLGFSAEGLREVMGGAELHCHYMVVNSWERGVDAEQNLVLISIPSVLDPSLAPDGMHTLHAYTPATEPYDLWKGLNRSSPEYARLKEERSEVLWKAIERVIPDIRGRLDLTLIGTPLTHERFLRRPRGSYGPALRAGESVFPGPGVPGVKGLLLCGDSVFPGVGAPAVAASGMIAANSLGLDTLPQHLKLLGELRVVA